MMRTRFRKFVQFVDAKGVLAGVSCVCDIRNLIFLFMFEMMSAMISVPVHLSAIYPKTFLVPLASRIL
jgi:hypothetical protein